MEHLARVALGAAVSGPAGWLAWRTARALAGGHSIAPLWAIMATMAAVLISAAAMVTVTPALIASLGLGWALTCLAVVDLATLRLPNRLTLPLIFCGLAVSFFLPESPVAGHLAGAAAGYGALVLLAWAYQRARGIEGIGLGDAKLLAAAGAWLGWRALPSVLLIACGAALLWIVAARLLERLPHRTASAAPPGLKIESAEGGRPKIAFGAPLGLAIWIVWLFGPLTR